MRILIYGQRAKHKHLHAIKELFQLLASHEIPFLVYREYLDELVLMDVDISGLRGWEKDSDIIDFQPSMMISLGGDGTILSAITHVARHSTPILGINMGRLGFLAGVEMHNIKRAVEDLEKGFYRVEERTMLQLDSDPDVFGTNNFALNDFTLHKRDTSSMITIHTYVNGEFLNSYWADGLIVSSPTGSTGYSLSCGGPIVFPQSGNFVITPVAPHNLNVRPIVISDESVITFDIEGRSDSFLCTLDSRFERITQAHQLAIRKSEHKARIVTLNDSTFLGTLQRKLHWGTDPRNV